MPKYIGQKCISCGKTFAEGDDIVVCPECGSPYHRECYKNEGKCVNFTLHELNREWQPAVIPVTAEEPTERVCANCGEKNSPDASFCKNCGVPLGATPPTTAPKVQGGIPGAPVDRQYGLPPFVNVSTVSADTDVDGNTVGEYSDYVGAKFFYYIPKFLRFSKTGSKISFNFAALFFTPFWFAYRKMPLYAVITWLITAVTAVPSTVLYLTQRMGMTIPWLDTVGFAVFYNLSYIVSNILSIAAAAFGNYLYYRKAKSDIDRIKQTSAGPESLKQQLSAAGGVSIAGVWAIVGLTVVFSFIMTMVFGLGSPTL